MGATQGGSMQVQPFGGATSFNPTASQNPLFGNLGGGASGLPASITKNAVATQQQPNMFNLSSSAIQDAMSGARGEMGFQPMMVQGGSYNPSMINLNQLLGYAGGGPSARASMIDPNQANMTAAQTSAAGIQKFMDPYTSQVIDTSLADIERYRQQQQNAAAAQAQAAGAFGGSRGALMEAEVGRNALDQAARTASQLRSQGYSQALNAAQQETGLRQQASAQNAQQQLQALLANQASGLAASQTNAQIGAQNQASRLSAMLGAMQSNQAAANRAPEFSLGQQLNAALANQGAQLAGSSQRLAAGNQLANIGNLGFGQAQQVLGGMNQAGAAQQQLMQQLFNAAQGQYGGYTGAGSNYLNGLISAISGAPIPTSSSTSSTPGAMDVAQTAAMMYLAFGSDIRTKDNIQRVGELPNGLGVYQWEWNEEGRQQGFDSQPAIGVIAQEVEKVIPDAVIANKDGYKMVRYGMIL